MKTWLYLILASTGAVGFVLYKNRKKVRNGLTPWILENRRVVAGMRGLTDVGRQVYDDKKTDFLFNLGQSGYRAPAPTTTLANADDDLLSGGGTLSWAERYVSQAERRAAGNR